VSTGALNGDIRVMGLGGAAVRGNNAAFWIWFRCIRDSRA
jgi:hypothetical protein